MIETGGLDQPEDYRRRLDPATPLRDDLEAEIARSASDPVNILDVGCGPATMIGNRTRGNKPFTVTSADPLGDQYAAIWKSAGHDPPHPIITVAAEQLASHLSAIFDIVFACNSLDHSVQPLQAIRQDAPCHPPRRPSNSRNRDC